MPIKTDVTIKATRVSPSSLTPIQQKVGFCSQDGECATLSKSDDELFGEQNGVRETESSRSWAADQRDFHCAKGYMHTAMAVGLRNFIEPMVLVYVPDYPSV